MKKITELSKIAIKLSEIHQFLTAGTIDFLRISDKFKEHSFGLIKELSSMLDMVNTYTFKQTIDRVFEAEKKVVEIIIESDEKNNFEFDKHNIANQIVKIESTSSGNDYEQEINKLVPSNEDEIQSTNKFFNSFENTILSPIKSIDSLLNLMEMNTEIPQELSDYAKLMNMNSLLSKENGFEILAQMHEIVALGLSHLSTNTLIPSKEVIESLRACLIVIVAVVRSKEIDITNYLNRAEVFGKFLKKFNLEEIK
jgi:hypothetical protein